MTLSQSPNSVDALMRTLVSNGFSFQMAGIQKPWPSWRPSSYHQQHRTSESNQTPVSYPHLAIWSETMPREPQMLSLNPPGPPCATCTSAQRKWTSRSPSAGVSVCQLPGKHMACGLMEPWSTRSTKKHFQEETPPNEPSFCSVHRFNILLSNPFYLWKHVYFPFAYQWLLIISF